MVDIGRDPRWGRVMEGAGEDPYLGSLIAKARVQGFQGDQLGATKTVKFVIDNQKLSFYNQQLEYGSEAGTFDLMIGASAEDIRLRDVFELVD